ncbi:MAG: pyrroline-5-carboxylate reductase [Spirochaetaceae bacterium]|jgi:pyrroline-5-carboxylate reductase|nr:pyrroline-5-carboxylate reductase [Spirochaetaceae bacterium]
MGTVIACIGSGIMGSALMRGAARSGITVGFTDARMRKAEDAAAEMGGTVYASNAAAAEAGDFIFLAVKPQVLEAVLAEIAPVLWKRAEGGNPPVVVSMAAGWSIARIQERIGNYAPVRDGFLIPVIRIMPNTPARIARGVIALSASPQTHQDRLAEAEKILAASGIVDRHNESYLDAVTGLSGSGPAFAYLFIEALADGGVRAGLSRDTALRYAAQTVLGAAAMVLETGTHPGALKDEVASPGGSTIAGIAALEAGAFRGTVISAVEAAWRRAEELGKQT